MSSSGSWAHRSATCSKTIDATIPAPVLALSELCATARVSEPLVPVRLPLIGLSLTMFQRTPTLVRPLLTDVHCRVRVVSSGFRHSDGRSG